MAEDKTAGMSRGAVRPPFIEGRVLHGGRLPLASSRGAVRPPFIEGFILPP